MISKELRLTDNINQMIIIKNILKSTVLTEICELLRLGQIDHNNRIITLTVIILHRLLLYSLCVLFWSISLKNNKYVVISIINVVKPFYLWNVKKMLISIFQVSLTTYLQKRESKSVYYVITKISNL
jgi:hypothetical protein